MVTNITQHGAKRGGDALSTSAIQNAIDSVAAQGGGVVIIPPGIWVSGTVFLRSNVWIEVLPGALLLGSPDPGDYPPQRPVYRSFHDANGFRALIYSEGTENIGIAGGGTIDGQGGRIPFVKDEHDVRPHMLQFISCRDVTVRDLRLQNSAMWLQHYQDCERVMVRGLRIWNHSNHNNDMIDIDGCRDVVVSDCISDTDDDGITLKSSGTARCENVLVSNCLVSSRCNAIKLGTESTGGFKNISIRNCIVRPSRAKGGIYGCPEGTSAISLEVVDGGRMEGITVSQIHVEGTRSPIFVRLANRGRRHKPEAGLPPIGVLKKVVLEDIQVRGAGVIGSSISGIPGAIVEDVSMSRVTIQNDVAYEGGALPGFPSEREADYPEATMFGTLPASGLFVRHARNIVLRDVTFIAPEHDKRTPVMIHRVEGFQSGGLAVTEV